MASPMRPSPIQPIPCDALLILMKPRTPFCVSPRAAVWEGMLHLSMSLRPVLLAMLAAALASCGGNLPNSAVSRHLAGRYAGALTDSTAVPTVIRDRDIKVPD